MLTLKFQNVSSAQGIAQERWQALLWVEADFVVEVTEGILLSEPHWCIVELAEHLAAWLQIASEDGPEFYYTSMDDEQEGLLWFRPHSNGQWLVGSAWQELENANPSSFQEIQNAARQYIKRVLIESRSFMSALVAREFSSVCA
ncbi:hypothetical protein GJ700_08895 [Duganella sp. FT92W]|uniref:DUF7878 domain-containing protein n=1 Tax=Pseudoduganella rivuli TaxID=2666085 RepID=A0A7X2IL38_9BURK|nr:hypothetical protein [Pseudoduganella rivuli]MRV71846.1 hypothetical protein [Pseudoduganella rivuli]